MKFALFSLALLACTVCADPNKTLDSLRAELREELKSALDKGISENNEQIYRIRSLLSESLPGEQILDEKVPQLIQTLGQVRTISRSEKAVKLCETLIAELRAQTANKAKEFREKFDSVVRSALVDGLKAKTAKELDVPISEIGKLRKQIRNSENRGDSQYSLNNDLLQNVEQALMLYQDGLMQKPDASKRDVGESLRLMTSTVSRGLGDLMPRSELLERIQAASERVSPAVKKPAISYVEAETQVRDTVRNIKKLEELGAAIDKIDAVYSTMRQTGGHYSDTNILTNLRSYRRTYDELRAGTATSMSFANASGSTFGLDELGPIKNMLVIFALPRVLRTPENMAPGENEPVSSYLQRVLDAAEAMRLSTVASPSDSAAMRQFFAGLNQERARQRSAAVTSYLAALKTGSQAVPSEHIGDRLEAIKKEFPSDFEAGEATTNTPAIYDDRFTRFPPRSMLPPPTPQNPQPPILVVPAVPKEAQPAPK